jgi:hypothetical protein
VNDQCIVISPVIGFIGVEFADRCGIKLVADSSLDYGKQSLRWRKSQVDLCSDRSWCSCQEYTQKVKRVKSYLATLMHWKLMMIIPSGDFDSVRITVKDWPLEDVPLADIVVFAFIRLLESKFSLMMKDSAIGKACQIDSQAKGMKFSSFNPAYCPAISLAFSHSFRSFQMSSFSR